jgi:hypothetical protein
MMGTISIANSSDNPPSFPSRQVNRQIADTQWEVRRVRRDGKTATLYSALDLVGTSELNIVTIEDPVE